MRARTGGIPALVAVLALLAGACSRVVTLEPPSIDVVPRVPPEQSIVYDATGNELAVLRHEFRERVALEDIASDLVDAVVVAEDRRFWTHAGVDARAVARAALANAAAGEVVQGGSTLTQQLVKNLYMPNAPRTPETKLREALLAHQLEEEHGKRWILEEYLNTVYFGSGAYGVRAATETYWRIQPSELTLPQAALLAGLLRAPETLDPHAHPERARDRRDEVLAEMMALGVISEAQRAAAAAEPVRVAPPLPPPDRLEPHWVDFVIRWLQDDPTFGATRDERTVRLYGGGLRIHTTLRPDLQASAREAISAHLPGPDDPEAAVVTIDPATGHVLAAAHAVPFAESQFDLATQAQRQPGSTFKAIVLAAALSLGWLPGSHLDGGPAVLTKPDGVRWTVANAGDGSYGTVTLATATRQSVNTAYARLTLEIGAGRVATLARSMGVASDIPDDVQIGIGGGSLAVTPLDMATAFATLANLGTHIPPTPVARIEDADGNVVWRPDSAGRRVLDPGVAHVTTELLRDVVRYGTGRAAQLPDWEVAGKTGTTDRHTDAWFVGYTPVAATAVWVGHPEGLIPMRNVQGRARVLGGTIPADIWRTHMHVVLAGHEPQPFTLPDEHTVLVEIDPDSGLRAAPWCPGEPTPLPRILVPTEVCPSPTPTPSPSPFPAASPSPTPTEASSPGASTSPTEVVTADPSPSPDTATSEPTEDGAGATDPDPAGSPTPLPSGDR